jgi:hypothetical protein
MNNLYRAIQDTAGWWFSGPNGFLCPVPDQAQAEDLARKMNQVIKEHLYVATIRSSASACISAVPRFCILLRSGRGRKAS